MSRLKEIRILPPMAIARMGNAEEPMDSFGYEGSSDSNEFRHLTTEPSFNINQDGTIEDAVLLHRIIEPKDFTVNKDGVKKVKPVAPFFELWGRFEDANGKLENTLKVLTKANIGNITLADITWEIDVANRKMSRRTKDENDVIERKVNGIKTSLRVSYEAKNKKHNILARSNNFANSKDEISFGHVQIITPSSDDDVLRLRFTPGHGKVFHQGKYTNGTKPKSKNQQHIQLKNSTWVGHKVGYIKPLNRRQENPLDPYPSNTIDGSTKNDVLISSGMFDDSCDGIISVSVKLKNNKALKAQARISVGPPDYSPDTQFIRSVDDELEQLILGPKATDQHYPNTEKGNIKLYKEIIAIIQSATDTVQVTKPADNAQKIKDVQKFAEDLSLIEKQLDYTNVITRHRQLLVSMKSFPLTLDWKSKAYFWVFWINNKLREKTEPVDTRNPNVWTMPIFMLDISQRSLTLTDRQRSKVELAVNRFNTSISDEPLCKMKELLYQLAPVAQRGAHHCIYIRYEDQELNLGLLFDQIVQDQKKGVSFNQSLGVKKLIDALEEGSYKGKKLIDSSDSPKQCYLLNLFYTKMVSRLHDRIGIILPIIVAWVKSVMDAQKIKLIDKKSTDDITEINIADLMQQIRYRPQGNPITSMLNSAVSNCFPGLEMDFRGIWQRLIQEKSDNNRLENDWILHETYHFLINKPRVDINDRHLIELSGEDGKTVGFFNPSKDRFNLLAQLFFNTDGEYTFDSQAIYNSDLQRFPPEEVVLNEIIDRHTGFINRLLPGELTHGLCSPWQHDFQGCVCAYWSANRPDFVDFDNTTNEGEKWMFASNKIQSGEGIPTSELLDENKDSRHTHEDLYENWQDKLQFIIKGRTKGNIKGDKSGN